MWNLLFWRDATERAFFTFAETMLGFIVIGTAIYTLDFATAGAVSATAALASLLKSIVSARSNKNHPSVSPASSLRDKRGVS